MSRKRIAASEPGTRSFSMPYGEPQIKAILSLTHRCNLSCTYCYAGRNQPRDMPFAIARQIVDFIMDRTQSETTLKFSFFGGEPLLVFEVLSQMTRYIQEQALRLGRRVRLGLTTNGTLLTPGILQFLSKEDFEVCISLDGPRQVHDAHRRFPDGRGSYLLAAQKIRLALDYLPQVQVNAVFGPDTLECLPESISFIFEELGVRVLSLSPDLLGTWSKVSLSKLRESYQGVARYYVNCYRAGRELANSLIDGKIILFLKGGYGAADCCSMGQRELAFAPSGNIYPCERFIGEDSNPEYCLGNIRTGLNESRCFPLWARRETQREECQRCNINKYCMNWCGCTNFYLTGSSDLVGPFWCASEQAAIAAAAHVLENLKDNDLFLEHLMGYLHERKPLATPERRPYWTKTSPSWQKFFSKVL